MDEMTKLLEEIAEISRSMVDLQEQHRRAMSASDWTSANDLQARIAELAKQRDKLRAKLPSS